MLENLEKWGVGIGIVATGFGVVASWFNLKSDVRSHNSRINSLESDKTLEKHGEDIEKLKISNARADMQRKHILEGIEKQNTSNKELGKKIDSLILSIAKNKNKHA